MEEKEKQILFIKTNEMRRKISKVKNCINLYSQGAYSKFSLENVIESLRRELNKDVKELLQTLKKE